MKVLELLTEGFLADQRAGVNAVRDELAKALRLLRHKVVVNRTASLGANGIRWVLAAPVPGDAKGEDAQFHLRMFQRLFNREIAKKFDKWKVDHADIAYWDASDPHGTTRPMMVITFFTPDMDGLLP